ncbi:YpoC family protein [Alkalihalobacillus sp. BA299]|uniref:YpoC family protein n=1 Tax=Alkalihalobacillus sp. BA299 TaxID=2815938 RepID=UPI001ADA6132|nr:hypothetical protein [Alkalihalobacillus sp. BA299]
MEKSYPIPTSFCVFPFYVEETNFNLNKTRARQSVLFYEDMLEALNVPNSKPWLAPQNYVPELFQQWKQINLHLSDLYKRRDRQAAKPLMIQQIAQLIQVIFWTNGVPVANLDQLNCILDQLQYKPVNSSERLSFIVAEPDHFQSYNQLKALFEEAEKMYYKIIAKNRQ